MKLLELAKVLRSKNAGPFHLTLDLMFEDKETCELVKNSGILDKKLLADLYGVNPEEVEIHYYPLINSIKITLPRRHPSGSIKDTDVYGAQQHIPLAELTIPNQKLNLPRQNNLNQP